MHRLPMVVARFLFVVAIGAVATALGTLLALGATPAGKALLARVFTDQSARLVRGSISIRRIEGNFLTRLDLDSVVVRDSTGFPLASLGRVEARFQLADLLAGRIVFSQLVLRRPRLYLVKHRNGRLNLEEVLKLGDGTGEGGGPGPLVELRNLVVEDGIVTVRTPWSPPGHLRTEAARDSALHAQRTTAGKRIEPGPPEEGLQQIRTIEGLWARFERLRLATPDQQPILAQIDSLTMILNDPLLEVRALAGGVRQARDTLWFEFNRAELPNTGGTAGGLVSWPQDTLLFDFKFDAERVALADLRFVSPDFPDLTGRGRLTARSRDGNLTEYDIRELDLRDSTQRITGSLVALTHRFQGLGFRDLDLALQNVDLDLARPYLDTLPFEGRLSGRLEAEGYFESMQVALDWSFFDDRIPGRPENRITLRGPVTMGGPDGFVFHEVQVGSADLDLETVRLAVPAFLLEGRMAGEGQLDGPWQNVTFTGRLAHQDGARPLSQAEGRIRTDTRGELLALDADLTLMPLEFEGIRRTFPTLTALGSVAGPVRLTGRLDSMDLWADLQGELGRVQAEGRVSMLPPHWATDSLRLELTGLDLAQARGTGPTTSLSGVVRLAGVVDSGVAPEGTLTLALTHGWVREIELDSLIARVAVQDSVITVDTAHAFLPRIQARASGTLGWVRPHGGRMQVTIDAERLLVLDSLVTVLSNRPPDSAEAADPLDGTLTVRVGLTGALDSLELAASGSGADLRWRGIAVPTLDGTGTMTRHSNPRFEIQVRADTVMSGRLQFTDLLFRSSGLLDSMRWEASGNGGPLVGLEAGGLFRNADTMQVAVDSLRLRVRQATWRPSAPFTLTRSDSVWSFPDVRFETNDGAAQLRLDGHLPGEGEGELNVTLSGLDLRDVYALLQRDTSQVAGTLVMDLRVAGTAANPLIRGTGSLTGPVFGTSRAPLTRIALNYQRQRLDANLTLWRTGMALMDVGATLPLDLSWSGQRRGSRQLPGQLAIRARADSMNLTVVEAFTRNLRQVRGLLTADVAVQGTWDAPRLGGTVEVSGASALVPNLGVRYGPLNGHLTMSGDSLLIDTVEVVGQEGRLVATGHIQLERLTRPILGLDLRAYNFVALDVPDFLEMQADGNIQLRGPLFHATMTGSATMRNSVVYFADLISKSIVNLEDPLYADLVDSAAIRERGLGAAFQSRFLDSLTIQNFQFQAAEGVWLRSSEANIQLEGGVTVQKNRNLYRLDGEFRAIRGTYNLRLLAITRSFDVTRGAVRYFGDPDLNADLDIEARHRLPSSDAEAAIRDLEITANITGTLRQPKLNLASNIRPPLSQTELISLLILRRTNSSAYASGQSQQAVQLAGLLAQTIASEFENVLRGQSQGGVDVVEIRPGTSFGVSGQSTISRLSAGWQLGNRWFVSLNTGFCPDFQQFDYRNFGASLDYRLSSNASVSVSAEPYQTCLVGGSGVAAKRYQFGSDLRWGREF